MCDVKQSKAVRWGPLVKLMGGEYHVSFIKLRFRFCDCDDKSLVHSNHQTNGEDDDDCDNDMQNNCATSHHTTRSPFTMVSLSSLSSALLLFLLL